MATCLDQLISIEQTCKCENAAGWMIHSHLGAQRTDGLMGFGSDWTSSRPSDNPSAEHLWTGVGESN